MGMHRVLVRLGLTNQETEDLGVLAMAKEREAVFTYCTSQKCCSYDFEKAGGAIIKKLYARVAKKADKEGRCPDCLATLFSRKGMRQ